MIHPSTKLMFINDTIGYGVFATELIPEGSIVYVKDPLELEISPEDYMKYPEEMKRSIEKYSYLDQKGYRILSWDWGKYVNHSCDSNTISTGYGFEFATRDIMPGEQITDEYGIFNLEEDMDCGCGSPVCRKMIKKDDFDVYYPIWDEKIQKSIYKVFDVNQPLFEMLDSETIADLELLKKNTRNYKSIYNLRHKKIPVTVSKGG